MAAHLLTSGDRDADNPLYNVDHLLELWDQIHAQCAAGPALAGRRPERPSASSASQARADIELLGRLRARRRSRPPSCFDVAPYARTADQGIRAAKVAEFIGLGVPTVSYDYEVTANLRETGAGVLVPDARCVRRCGRAPAHRRRSGARRARRCCRARGTRARLGRPRAALRATRCSTVFLPGWHGVELRAETGRAVPRTQTSDGR